MTPWTAAHQILCPSPTPGAYSNSCPSSWWFHPTISSSVIPFSSCLQSFPAWGSFPISLLFTSGGQSNHINITLVNQKITNSVKKFAFLFWRLEIWLMHVYNKRNTQDQGWSGRASQRKWYLNRTSQREDGYRGVKEHSRPKLCCWHWCAAAVFLSFFFFSLEEQKDIH